MSTLSLQTYKAYRVETTAGRVLYLLFRDRLPRSPRLWFTELDPPYGNVLLKPRHIKSATPL